MPLPKTDFRIGNIAIINAVAREVTASDLFDVNGDTVFEGLPVSFRVIIDYGFDRYHDNPRMESFYINKQGYYPFFIYSSRSIRYYFNENVLIEYFHQLQNLFKLHTGEELKRIY